MARLFLHQSAPDHSGERENFTARRIVTSPVPELALRRHTAEWNFVIATTATGTGTADTVPLRSVHRVYAFEANSLVPASARASGHTIASGRPKLAYEAISSVSWLVGVVFLKLILGRVSLGSEGRLPDFRASITRLTNRGSSGRLTWIRAPPPRRNVLRSSITKECFYSAPKLSRGFVDSLHDLATLLADGLCSLMRKHR